MIGFGSRTSGTLNVSIIQYLTCLLYLHQNIVLHVNNKGVKSKSCKYLKNNCVYKLIFSYLACIILNQDTLFQSHYFIQSLQTTLIKDM